MTNRIFGITAVVTVVAAVSLGLASPVLAQDSAGSPQGDPGQFARGAQTWADNCDRCHNMRDPKEFRDDQWRSIVSHMRVRGGLTGQEARDALAFLQGSNSGGAAVSSTTATATPTTAVDDSRAAPSGQAIYAQTCVACHGPGGEGAIPGVPDFTGKDSPLSKSDADLVKNISEGFQSPGSFMAMPAKGGNPALTEEDVKAVLAYLRAEFGN